MTKKKSDFQSWFRAQYGPAPTRLTIANLNDRVAALSSELCKVTNLRDRLYEYQHDRDVALKAWCAAEKQKGAK